ncbi:ATP-binding protein [Corallococcus macrosporus]|uniref:ATP-binding protein n=1 Tax=Corallococcus macrosporus TaxID=35 RepID=A0ABS3DLT2_9BACT|nr:ATP-binding protein [Corallococcus macrosporus]MBN8232294.1 ATP-binding protein [Corallococcus macrosporus]
MAAQPLSPTKLAKQISEASPGESPIQTELSTSERVLRRVTDGIYREPWSALRELVSNAYDADATEVVIETDAPRFERIIIRDNGVGFTSDSLASMIKNIGGSTKRTISGATVGVTSANDPTLSPGGRRLIGKLGIGLFAVSQLTHEFQVITKRAGEKTRTVADVILFQYAENKKAKTNDETNFQTGSVRIWKTPARDRKSQGTEIILRNLLPKTRAELTSEKLWTMVSATVVPGDDDERETWQRPRYHIGRVNPANPSEYLETPEYPWNDEASPSDKFELLTQRMFARASEASGAKPSLENTFDNYLRFIWKLSLAAPLDYMHGHPFDLNSGSEPMLFKISNARDGSSEPIVLAGTETVREKFNLKSPERGTNSDFRVLVDGVLLKRPLKFRDLPTSDGAVNRPLLFIGHDRPDLSRYPETIRGGDLEFEAYLLWTPRVVPTEHNGVLLRINDASGTLFDPTFMDYRVSEQTRMRQVVAEIFITEGLDAALNLDRESFNVSHPHYQYIALWVHNAFKQFATRHKDLAKKVRTQERSSKSETERKHLARVAAEIVSEWSGGDEKPVPIEFTKKIEKSSKEKLAFSIDEVFKAYGQGERRSAKKDVEFKVDQEIMRSVAQVLLAAGVFEKMSHAKQQKLLADLAKVIFYGRGS